MAEYDIKDKVVLITGAAGGLGTSMIQKFLEAGAKHVAALDISKDAGMQKEKELNAIYDGKVKFHQCDITKDDELFNAYDKTVADHGYVDIVVNNAGLMNDSQNIYKKQIDINVTALVTNSLKALESMRKDNGGRGGTIINIASIVALNISPVMPIYSATKSAVLMFSNCLGKIYNETGVRVLAICFGPSDTGLFDKLGSYDKKTDEKLKDKDLIYQTFTFQSADSATDGVIHACKKTETSGTWLVANGMGAKDISKDVTEAYEVLSRVYVTDVKNVSGKKWTTID